MKQPIFLVGLSVNNIAVPHQFTFVIIYSLSSFLKPVLRSELAQTNHGCNVSSESCGAVKLMLRRPEKRPNSVAVRFKDLIEAAE